MKTYPRVDLTGDSYINPLGATYADGSGTHQRAAGIITSIAIHHDAVVRPHDYDSAARYRAEAAAHYLRLGPGLQYHYKIDNVGTIFQTRPHNTWLYAVGTSENVSSINVCLDGNFETQQPTREQLEALYQLLEDLCTKHPEFPATWTNVRPHADYSATACCGASLRDRIYPIKDQATAQAQLLNQGTFDWPETQPSAPTPPATRPIPPTMPINVNFRVHKAGKQLGAYKLDVNAWNKYVSDNADKITDQDGGDVTAALRLKFAPPPEAPSQIPDGLKDPTEKDHTAQLEDIKSQLNVIQQLVEWIKDLLSSVFKR